MPRAPQFPCPQLVSANSFLQAKRRETSFKLCSENPCKSEKYGASRSVQVCKTLPAPTRSPKLEGSAALARQEITLTEEAAFCVLSRRADVLKTLRLRLRVRLRYDPGLGLRLQVY